MSRRLPAPCCRPKSAADEGQVADLPALGELRVGNAPVPVVGRLQALLVLAEHADALDLDQFVDCAMPAMRSPAPAADGTDM